MIKHRTHAIPKGLAQVPAHLNAIGTGLRRTMRPVGTALRAVRRTSVRGSAANPPASS